MSEIQIAGGITVRYACKTDIPAIRAMQQRSMAVLGVPYYSPVEIAAFMTAVGTMDDAVVDEGHYFCAEDARGTILASGGWSRREPGYDRGPAGGMTRGAQPHPATVRSVFIDPPAARRGIASALMAHVEADAARHEIHVLRLTAMLSGLAFYTRLGWRAEGEKAIVLPGGLRFGCMSMSKPISRRFIRPHRVSAAMHRRLEA